MTVDDINSRIAWIRFRRLQMTKSENNDKKLLDEIKNFKYELKYCIDTLISPFKIELT